MNQDKLQALARDLSKTPRSPHKTLGGFVMGARMLDEARTELLGIGGEGRLYPYALGPYFWRFTGLDPAKFKAFVATGATDEEVDRWVRQNATQKDPKAIRKWNNGMRGLMRFIYADPGLPAVLPSEGLPSTQQG
jgi:hypothetical protein